MRMLRALAIALAAGGCGGQPAPRLDVTQAPECRGVIDSRAVRDVLATALRNTELADLPRWCATPRHRFGDRLRVGAEGRVEETNFGGCAQEVWMDHACPDRAELVAALRFPPPSPPGQCAWVDVPADLAPEVP